MKIFHRVFTAACCCSVALAIPLASRAADLLADPEIEQASLQLIDGSTGRLMLQLRDTERRQLLKSTGRAAFALAADPREAAVSFNDLGEGADVRAGDGLFSGAVPINLELLRAISAEAAQLRTRRIQRFIPGSRQSVGVEELPAVPIDVERLRAGGAIRLPRLGEFGPLRTLGAGSTAPIDPQKSLLISSLPIIEDPVRSANPCAAAAQNLPLKSWSFGHLMEQMSQGSGLTPAAFTENWLNHWRKQQTILDSTGALVLDGVSAAALAQMDSLIIKPWRQRSGGGALNLSIAPFRLQAIVYRPDLGGISYGAKNSSAGELRFVFGAMQARDNNADGDATDAGDTCQSIEAAVIFEYGVPIQACVDVKTWASDWISLSGLLPGSVAFNSKLESLTEAVVLHGAAPTKPNQNALNQLRTNEISLTGIWQFREFRLPLGGGALRQSTVASNPREHQALFTSVPGVTPLPINLNGSQLLFDEINNNQSQLIDEKYQMPEIVQGLPFQGGASSYTLSPTNTSWDHPGLGTPMQLEARFRFSLNTCSGCHTRETLTDFYHIRPKGVGFPPDLSPFLRDNPHVVADVRGLVHEFNEMDKRKQALSGLANGVCGFKPGIPLLQKLAPLKSVH